MNQGDRYNHKPQITEYTRTNAIRKGHSQPQPTSRGLGHTGPAGRNGLALIWLVRTEHVAMRTELPSLWT